MPTLDDDLTFSILALLRKRAGEASDRGEWTTAIELAQTLGLAIEVTSEELDLLEHRGRIEVERRSAESNELKARITTAGRAQLAARNKAQRQAVKPNPGTDDQNHAYDVFMSHASEDCESFVDRLVDELDLIGVKVWYDLNALLLKRLSSKLGFQARTR